MPRIRIKLYPTCIKRHHVVGIGGGIIVMLVGSSIAVYGPHHILVDALAYFLHGCGALPTAHHVEKLWMHLMQPKG